MSYKEDYQPSGWWYRNTESLNPLTWTLDTSAVSIEDYMGTVVLNPKRRIKRKMTARVADVGGRVLYVKTKAPWFRLMKNLHVADYGLFYHSIRDNVATRIEFYRTKNGSD
jgi:hypothetical protein